MQKSDGSAGYRSPCLSHAKRALSRLSYTPRRQRGSLTKAIVVVFIVVVVVFICVVFVAGKTVYTHRIVAIHSFIHSVRVQGWHSRACLGW